MIAATLLFSLLGCGGPTTPPVPRVTLDHQEVTVGCGMCRFKMEGSRGCFWAIELEGGHWPVLGELPTDHQNHAPDGMCNVDRRAVVSGTLAHGAFTATAFELLPPAHVPDQPEFTPADLH